MMEEILKTARDALQAAYCEHEILGAAGQDIGLINQFGEAALRLDVACEQRVIELASQRGLPLRIVSEEHGTTDLTEAPEMLAVLDGLDGSNLYRTERGTAHYGTMLCISSNLDPMYQEYVVSGIMEHSPKARLLIAFEGQGAFLEADGRNQQVQTSGNKALDTAKPILSAWDSKWADGLPTHKLSDCDLQSFGSMAAAFMRLATGEIDVILDITRKRNLEQMIAFGIIRAAGGDAVTKDGESIGRQYFQKFGLNDLQREPIIWASTPELARLIAVRCFN
jgi:fructose-1,6-bisphosphatase/inositol monophosphatase family enzyme